jgi:hypothetical protein
LQTFDKTSACIRLRLFTGSRRVRVHKGHLKNSVIQAFRLAFSLSFQQPLSQEFQVRFEVENIEDKHSPLQ